jgi:hypothetical protein
VGQFADLAMMLTGAGVGLWLAKRYSDESLVRGCFLTIGVVLIVSPVVNPQYLLWIVPFFALGASGVLTRRKHELAIGTAYLAIGGIGYLLALFGWADLLAPSSFAFGWPTPRTITSLWTALSTTSNMWSLLPSLGSKLALLSTLSVLTGGVLAAVGTIRGRESLAGKELAAAKVAPPLRYRSFATVSLPINIVEAFALASPSFAPPPKLSASVTASGARSASIAVATVRGDQVRFAAFAVTRRRKIQRMLYYYSPTYPDSGSENSTVVGTKQALQNLLGKFPIAQVRAGALPGELGHTGVGTMLVDVAGTLPNTIWGGANSHILLSWIRTGGILVFAGDVPGFYSVGSGPMTVGVDQHLAPNVSVVGSGVLLPPGIVGGAATSWVTTPYEHPSSWGTALGLSYNAGAVPLSIEGILANHGTVLGHIGPHRDTSEAFVPIGSGGVVDFSGYDTAGSIANDIAHLVLSNFFSHIGYSVATSILSSRGVLHLALPRRAKGIEVFASSTNRHAIWTWAKEIPWNK